ncbi:hypothetical protein H8A97_17845 [Bradyrhizobium sp. Arg62]|uniref:hypothetical protein n=1 Tax=Bradyrhizobium brasilense TaxID=1419277 RepID=UPI001E58A9E4|nr:hypothetical protein [Bradyrhizobium brasilense]MCC8946921.1 hypothetical protein [Bradyrhizobium brasilense]
MAAKRIDPEQLAMNNGMTSLAKAVALVAMASLVATSAVGACKTTLRGELVQAPGDRKASVGEFLYFYLVEMTTEGPTGPEKLFQSFVVPNTSETLPIPFALEIDQPKDCPGELELRVDTKDRDIMRLGTDTSSAGGKTIRLERFESVPMWGPLF